MVEQLVDVLRDAHASGWEVWDSYYNEVVLLLPWILAFLGDNPMASEFASHIGMNGKFFCRVCKANDTTSGKHRVDFDAFYLPFEACWRLHCPVARQKGFKVTSKDPKGRQRSPDENAEIARVQTFLQAGAPRTKEETVANLHSQLRRALNGAPSAVDEMATNSGTKDKFFAHFLDQLQTASSTIKEQQRDVTVMHGGLSRADQVRAHLEQCRAQMPPNLFNPVLRVPHFDAHSETPFEALHCVLLGAVKYFWRDAVARQTSEGKETLKVRLSSINTTGLSISPLRGHTLVQYAGSLVGRDFQVVLQVAPAVLHGLIPTAAYEAWTALCRLAPLIFQPEINDLELYLTRLDSAVADFLSATALWTTQWFNKPKFHLFVHLPAFVRRFGPPILYATEGFESFNLVIRLRSINSNRHAPSIDIAHAFDYVHAVRHLVSGGLVWKNTEGQNMFVSRAAGVEICRLVEDKQFVKMMCMHGLFAARPEGTLSFPKNVQPCTITACETVKAGFRGLEPLAKSILQAQSVELTNHDQASVGAYVVYTMGPEKRYVVRRVDEILVDAKSGQLLGMLLTQCALSETEVIPYRLPRIIHLPTRDFHAYAFALCMSFTIVQSTIARHSKQNPSFRSGMKRHADIIQRLHPLARYPTTDLETTVVHAVRGRVHQEEEARQQKSEQDAVKAEKKAKTAQRKAAQAERKAAAARRAAAQAVTYSLTDGQQRTLARLQGN
ncbi:hypothetical protein CERSUDRAFT_101018 [Gelatoporia subvermispora B]|uniref:Uncharacterized protein n=1 Tax=Ceriporiopsis subvermispora (strain B) TaxID=914234 RepID=M2QW64_CERS8|nr:hypothetical protein CERSUDRAFT_101018 [Gelatoporia subvermispora B]